MTNDRNEIGNDILNSKKQAGKSPAETVRTWVEISHRDLSKIKRTLNYPVRSSKRGQKNNSEVLAEFIARTLRGEVQTTSEKLEEVREEFVKKLVQSFSVSVDDEAGVKATASMLIKRVCRERDNAKAELEALKNEVSKSGL